jgi:anaerobic ribonucleoside-triphosphate reductase
MENKKERTPCLTYSRVCGWLAPTANFNPGKKSEREDRVDFKIK